MERADHRQFFGLPGDQGEVLTDPQARRGGRDGGERPSDVFRGIGLGVPGVEMARTAPLKDHDTRPRLAEPSRRGPARCQGTRRVSTREQTGKTQARQSEHAGAERSAARRNRSVQPFINMVHARSVSDGWARCPPGDASTKAWSILILKEVADILPDFRRRRGPVFAPWSSPCQVVCGRSWPCRRWRGRSGLRSRPRRWRAMDFGRR